MYLLFAPILSYLQNAPSSFYQNNSFCYRRLSSTSYSHHTSVFNPQLSCSTTTCKCSTTKMWSVGTLLCWGVQCRASSGNTSPSRRGYKTPSSTYTQLRRAVSCPWRYFCNINAPAMPFAALSDCIVPSGTKYLLIWLYVSHHSVQRLTIWRLILTWIVFNDSVRTSFCSVTKNHSLVKRLDCITVHREDCLWMRPTDAL